MKNEKTYETMEISSQEWAVIQSLRELKDGQLVVSVESGKPTCVETRKSIDLTLKDIL
ncbi:hypothetical protein [Pseudoflavonifractor sp. MCC625]|uniref:hypothetical protein n=1 Tax=Pseudoflavonifractor sp. MCC625 TaxID=2592647 RepID=UPI001C025B15|nr:hypothetical protein [Pseudoflavonifractor sp. MCC625]MBT9685288.1 hypothetical protein [Pseudoflavonifractor sp. MCC625]